MHQSPKAAAQAVTDLAQRIGASQLTEQHGDELRPAGKAFGGTLSSVLLYEYGELGSGKVMEQLIKQACDLYDWVALLWAAFGEFPARNGSPTSIIGGHSSYFRLQEPVLDKSDFTILLTLSPLSNTSTAPAWTNETTTHRRITGAAQLRGRSVENSPPTMDSAGRYTNFDRFSGGPHLRTEEHTSELQSLRHLVC